MLLQCTRCNHQVICLSLFELYHCYSLQLQLEEEEAKDTFDVDVAVTNPEKVGQSQFFFILSQNYDTALYNLQFVGMLAVK